MSEFYKLFKDQIIPHLQALCLACWEDEDIPVSWKSAKFSLIPKVEKDLAYPGNYQFISLLNADYKILTTILSDRINKVINH